MNRFKNIMFVADCNQSCPALERAVTLAETNHARLTVVDVIDNVNDDKNIQARIGVSLNKLLYKHKEEELAKLVAPFQSAETIIYTKVLVGTAYAEIIRAVMQYQYDLVIKTMHPPSTLSERLLGSTHLHLLRKCPCPVWIDRPGKKIPYRKILAAVDPDDEGDVAVKTLQLSISLAERERAELEIVHAWQLEGESVLRGGYARLSDHEVDHLVSDHERSREKNFNALLSDFGLTSDNKNVHFVKGSATENILMLGESADLIVMGTIGRTGIPGFLIGNTAEDVMQLTRSSILAVKPEGFVSPFV